MVSFNTLYNEYDNTKNGDVFSFCEKYKKDSIATRFLLIRSFDAENLKNILQKHKIIVPKGREKLLMESVYNSSISINDLLDYIEAKRAELIAEREKEVYGLDEVLQQVPVVNCGIRNDNLDTIVKAFTRNKSIKSYSELVSLLDTDVLSKVRQYCLWSYYNQTSNDIIELSFLKHKNVIPTLRKVYNIDFFLKIDGDIIPFDLKITHISDDYFEFASKGILPSSSTFDDYIIDNNNIGELQTIKDYYKNYKKLHKNLDMPKISAFQTDVKASLCNYISKLDNSSAQFISKLKQEHSRYIPTSSSELKKLEWWNYKYQGERLFCNNNRLFIFLAYKTQFVDGRNLKGNTAEIDKRVNYLLDNLSFKGIHKIKYHYDKLAKLEGDYLAYSISTIYYE